MRIEEMNKDLKRAYQTMVDTVEDLVVNQGENLQQALQIAEEQLGEWKDLSKEEVEVISSELKHDFKKLEDNLSESREAYKEAFKKEAAYVSDSIWSKLLTIMDTNTAQLLAFQKNLNERVLSIKSADHLTEHEEHTQWSSDHGLWLAEVEIWKKEHAEALGKLAKIEKAIAQHSTLLDEHVQVIKAHEARDHEHEEVLAKAEHDPTSHVFEVKEDEEAAVHAQEKQEHTQHAELHDTMRKHHFTIISLVNKLYKEIS
ncbi:hypothetical protein [uncultured Cocleimonas sp.]|uniref:zinc ribbon-containing protein n=1 Tax=uncultured Cocleimonas sp. TaxID=1051587 RepID=UPI0026122C3A|nr:hypothetical protein [uncultured Cocleimonas sp.]